MFGFGIGYRTLEVMGLKIALGLIDWPIAKFHGSEPLVKLIIAQLVKNFPVFNETSGLGVMFRDLYPELDKSLLFLLFNWTVNGILPGGSGTTIRHNTEKYTHPTRSDKTQHSKLHKQ
jgi:hypothetical protein